MTSAYSVKAAVEFLVNQSSLLKDVPLMEKLMIESSTKIVECVGLSLQTSLASIQDHFGIAENTDHKLEIKKEKGINIPKQDLICTIAQCFSLPSINEGVIPDQSLVDKLNEKLGKQIKILEDAGEFTTITDYLIDNLGAAHDMSEYVKAQAINQKGYSRL
jgi:hypothetical protein